MVGNKQITKTDKLHSKIPNYFVINSYNCCS